MIEVSFLASGSSGNCAVIRSGRATVLLDAGLSVRETKRRLHARGVALEEIQAVFLTHEHSDHVRSGLALAAACGAPVYATPGTARAAGFPGALFADVRTLSSGEEIEMDGSLNVRSVPTPHDGAESVCYVFADAGGRRVGIVTDLGHLSGAVLEALADCEILGLEANHDVDLLRTGPYPAFLKRRILSDVGHLSNEAAAAGLNRLLGARTLDVTLLHLSRQNNTPALAAQTLQAALDQLGCRVPLRVAAPDVPTDWISAGTRGGGDR